jgi:hypothetical protein
MVSSVASNKVEPQVVEPLPAMLVASYDDRFYEAALEREKVLK